MGYQLMYITIARENCTSCGNCVLVAPEFFDLDDNDARVVLIKDQPNESEIATIREAINDCPTDVLDLIDG